MAHSQDPETVPPPSPTPHIFSSIWAWLAKPLASGTTRSARRSRLLAWVLLSILFICLALLVLVAFADPSGSPRRTGYISLIIGIGLLAVIAYALNRAGDYALAASLIVSGALLAPWASAILDPLILQGDFVPLAYSVVPILLSSILLTPFITAVLAGAQLFALVLIASAYPATGSINWPSLLGLIFVTSVLCILSSTINERDSDDIDRRTLELAESAARQRELSVRDHLTQLFNRRYLEETLAREIRRSARAHRIIGILLFDIDQFKQVNDTWGHAAGDLILQQIGHLASGQIRGGDIACRYGGDEFVLVMAETSRHATRLRADRLRKLVRALRVEYEGRSLGAITISIGIALYPDHGASGEALLKSADDALYRAKAAGRDRVVMAEKNSTSPYRSRS